MSVYSKNWKTAWILRSREPQIPIIKNIGNKITSKKIKKTKRLDVVNEFTNANSRINNINKKNLTFSTLEYQLTKIQIGTKNVVNNIKKTETPSI